MEKLTCFHLLFVTIMVSVGFMMCATVNTNRRRDQRLRVGEEEEEGDDDDRQMRKCSMCFGRMRSLKREKPCTELDTVEVEELLVEKLRKYWQIKEGKLEAPRKLCSNEKLFLRGYPTDAFIFFSNKFIRIVRGEGEGEYKEQRVQFSHQNEGGKDMTLLACRCDITKEDTDSDTIQGPESPDLIPEGSENSDYDDPGQILEPARPSTDSIDIFFGCSAADKPKFDSPKSRSGSSSPASLEISSRTRPSMSTLKIPEPEFSRARMSLSSRRFEDSEDVADSSEDGINYTGPEFKGVSLVQSRKPTSIRFPDNGEPSSTALSRKQAPGRLSADYGNPSVSPTRDETTPQFPRLRKSFSSRTKLTDSNESQFNEVNQEVSLTGRRTRSVDLTRVGISPSFSRWVINNAEEVSAANICVDGRLYISRGMNGKDSFFFYAKNFEDETFNVIGHFKL